MKLIIRKGEEADLQAMAAIEQMSFSDPWSEESFREMLALPAARTLIAWTDGDEPRPIGYLIAFSLPPEAEIVNIAIAPRYRKCGYGRALMEEGLKQLAEEGCDSFFLEVREHNLPAQALYSRLGFVQTGRRKRYYQNPVEDAILMARLPLSGD